MGGCICLVVAFPLFFLILHLSLLSTRADNQFSNCPDQNEFCGKLNIGYPFFYNHWGCGLERLYCTNLSFPIIHSSDEKNETNTYEVQSIDYTKNTVLAHYLGFSQPGLLTNNDKCKFLFNNFTTVPPIFHHLSSQVISPIVTLRVCKPSGVNNGFCKVEVLVPEVTVDATAPAPSTLNYSSSNDCRVVYLPMDVPPSTLHGLVDPVSQLFAVRFHVRWGLPLPCPQCDKNGTFCVRYDDDSLFCSNLKDTGSKTQTKIIGIGIAAGVVGGILLTSLIIFMIYKHRTGHIIGVQSFSLKTDLEESSTHYGVPIFSYAELEQATNNFSSVNVLGDGASGTVYHGKLQEGRDVAIKRLYHNDCKHVERFMNEIQILTGLRHQNLVNLYGCTSYRSRELLLVYEFISNGTVADHLHGDRGMVGGSLTWLVRMSIAIETASALSYLHASDVIHRDVKTSNILLDNHFQVKVADFGLCRLFPIDASHVSTDPQGTPGYLDPEYHQCYQLTDKSDVYSFGAVLIELISSKPAIDLARHRDEINLATMAMNKIQNGALQELVDPCLGFDLDSITRGMVALVAELAFRCLQREKELRPSMDEVLEILMATRGKEYKVDNGKAMDILASSDEPPKNIPPSQASPDSET